MSLYIKIKNNRISDKDLDIIRKVIKKGGIVAFPTDTVYGIGASVSSRKAVRKLFLIKKRPSSRPIPILVSSKTALKKAVARIPSAAGKLIDKYWPGALTIILPRSRRVSSFITRGSKNVAVRMPDNKTALKVIEAAGGLMAVTSANISGKKEATSAKGLKALKGIDIVIDGGRSRIGKASTIIDISGRIPQILRQGSLRVELDR